MLAEGGGTLKHYHEPLSGYSQLPRNHRPYFFWSFSQEGTHDKQVLSSQGPEIPNCRLCCTGGGKDEGFPHPITFKAEENTKCRYNHIVILIMKDVK